MSTEQNNKRIAELETAKDKLTKLIQTLKEDPSFSEGLDQLSGGFSEIKSEESSAPFLDVNVVAC